MKALLCIGMTVALVGIAQEPRVSTPSVTARTAGSSSATRHTASGNTSQVQAVRSTGAVVSVNFFTPPPDAYDIQCFFIAKNESNKQRFVFDTATQKGEGRAANAEFNSRPLIGTTTQTTSIPISGTFNGVDTSGAYVNGTFRGAAVSGDTALGAKIEGWIVRVVYKGQVLHVDSNQPQLIDLANSMPQVFDAAIGRKK